MFQYWSKVVKNLAHLKVNCIFSVRCAADICDDFYLCGEIALYASMIFYWYLSSYNAFWRQWTLEINCPPFFPGWHDVLNRHPPKSSLSTSPPNSWLSKQTWRRKQQQRVNLATDADSHNHKNDRPRFGAGVDTFKPKVDFDRTTFTVIGTRGVASNQIFGEADR